MRRFISVLSFFSLLAFPVLALLPSLAWATSYDESVNGDLSGDRAHPTSINLTTGSNLITATSMSGDVEYITITLPAGQRLSAIVVKSNTSTSLSFIGVQAGATFTEPPSGTNVAHLLGYSHFGVGNATIGQDILPMMGTAAGAIDFSPPLTAPPYTFWSQETSSAPSTYTLDFQVTAPPANVPLSPVAMGALALLLVAAGASRRLRRI
jgi:hypothetical protein